MHLYGTDDLKYKTIRSWARAYGEELKKGETYLTQLPVICVTFMNGSLDDSENKKVHKCCKIMDIDDYKIFSDSLELHYIDMQMFVDMINKHSMIDDSMLSKWLAIITEKDIKDKSIIENICKEKEEIEMVVSTLVRLSDDKIARQAYQRRQDDIALYNHRLEYEKNRADQAENRADQAENRADQAELEIQRLQDEIKKLQAVIK